MSSLNSSGSSRTGDRRRTSAGSVQQYQLDKQLDPQQLNKIIYQPGCSYATAVAGQRVAPVATMEFNLHGFSQYLARSQCLSVLLFWKEAEEYLHLFSQGDRAACAQRIFQRYMRNGAEFEINLSGINDTTVAGIEAKLTKPPGALRCLCAAYRSAWRVRSPSPNRLVRACSQRTCSHTRKNAHTG